MGIGSHLSVAPEYIHARSTSSAGGGADGILSGKSVLSAAVAIQDEGSGSEHTNIERPNARSTQGRRATALAG